ncbi:MAG TPA: S8 family peptidase [Lachnospiraceae bacterium]|nr:S8 family peptidase [Lachnospiraceae bacterium]
MEKDCRDRIVNEEYADFMINFGKPLEDIQDKLDTCYGTLNNETAIVYTPVASVPSNFIHLFGYGAYPNCYGILDEASVEASGITKVKNIPNLNLQGDGVLIGIIDTGIEYTHEAFRKADGTSKIYAIWDQAIMSDNPPEGYQFGTEYKQEQINNALASEDPLSVVPSTDEVGHGTFLAGIAAGNPKRQNSFTGIVPNAELVVVKLKPAKKYIREFWKIPDGVVCYQKNDFIQAIRYLLDQALKLKRPISIAIGIGTSQGAHDDRGSLSRYLSAAAALSGVCISIAAGNEGNARHHYQGAIAGAGKNDTVELNVGANEKGFTMEFWGKTPGTFSIDITSPNGEYVPRILARLNETREIRFIFDPTVIQVDYQLVESQSGDQLILVRFSNPTQGIWRFRVYSSGNLSINYHTWLPITQFISNETYFVNSEPYYTLTSPANVFVPIVATSYDYTNESLSLNASRGYTRTESIAPTIAAPGVNIIGPTINNSYTTLSGTSIAAAHTAGVGAMFLEWGIGKNNLPNISTIEIKNLLIRGAKRSDNLVYPNKEWGYGILDLMGAYNSLRSDNP